MNQIPPPPSNCYDVQIALIICACIVVIGILALITILVYRHQLLEHTRLMAQMNSKVQKEEQANNYIIALRTKKLECIKSKDADYSNNKDVYLKQIDEFLNEEK